MFVCVCAIVMYLSWIDTRSGEGVKRGQVGVFSLDCLLSGGTIVNALDDLGTHKGTCKLRGVKYRI